MKNKITNKPFNKKIAIIVIVLPMITMQWHSVYFWTEKTGIIGWGFSFGIEAAMLWLWYEDERPYLRVIAAALLIAGPLYQLTIPISSSISKSQFLLIEVKSFQDEVTQLKADLNLYQENSKKYRRSANRIDKTETRLDNARDNFESPG